MSVLLYHFRLFNWSLSESQLVSMQTKMSSNFIFKLLIKNWYDIYLFIQANFESSVNLLILIVKLAAVVHPSNSGRGPSHFLRASLLVDHDIQDGSQLSSIMPIDPIICPQKKKKKKGNPIIWCPLMPIHCPNLEGIRGTTFNNRDPTALNCFLSQQLDNKQSIKIHLPIN